MAETLRAERPRPQDRLFFTQARTYCPCKPRQTAEKKRIDLNATMDHRPIIHNPQLKPAHPWWRATFSSHRSRSGAHSGVVFKPFWHEYSAIYKHESSSLQVVFHVWSGHERRKASRFGFSLGSSLGLLIFVSKFADLNLISTSFAVTVTVIVDSFD
eukprot:scaffold304712_cov28-Tisochrysis_lutea.AAC.1